MNKKIQELLKLFEESSIAKMELEVDDLKIKFEKFQPSMENPLVYQAAIAETTSATSIKDTTIDSNSVATHSITAPLVGIFYSSREFGGKPLVSIGDQVKRGDTLCVIEAMKVMNEICSDQDGTITAIKVNNESMVQYQQELFVIAL